MRPRISAPPCAQPTLIRDRQQAFHNCSANDLAAYPQTAERFGTDEGPQVILLALDCRPDTDEAGLEHLLQTLQRPPHTWDDYQGVSRVARFE